MSRFTSTERLVPVLAGLVGEAAARQRLSAWLDERLAHVGSRAFAARFRAHFDRFDAAPLDFAHRIVPAGDGEILAGIRFYGGDAERPFVDVMAWQDGLDVGAVSAAVREAWHMFRPFALRIVQDPAQDVSGAYCDQGIHAACVADMPATDGSVALAPVTDIEEAHDLVREKHADLRSRAPEVAREVIPTDAEGLDACRRDGTLHFIVADGERAGLIATLPGQIEFVPGDVIVEEIVRTPFNGRGLAAAAQGALAATLRAARPEAVLAGTIHRANHASRISAQRAGRPAVLEYAFVDL